jgi:hypothetical protein
MIKVFVGSNLSRESVTVDETSTTLRSVMDDKGVDYNRFTCHLNGDTVSASDLDKTFADCGMKNDDTCYLVSVTKADSAAL